MIVEHAILQVRPGQSAAFEAAMVEARPLIAIQPGFRSIEVRNSDDDPEQYLLLVVWDNIESHRDGFRKSTEYQHWRALLHPFYDPMPVVNYYGRSILS
ncbi:MAG: heme-degrading monooxygenase HmoA [Parasphingorhabdus sp.]|jgi:heme-degrading monooxygenase HmoA|uniref:antibiotic biosynthesis monooxygenase family protein n=1 Tax=Parasphingorhabdus sp. TaxID=2709688 RepID=UPI002B2724E6|nr:antibiotic biosynthesis monooxygenase [Parasphingorhabdus sp.]|tara:strand:- start:398 stop:694 length:297 start_codon:yes stop_codon:yes gene_type:complete